MFSTSLTVIVPVFNGFSSLVLLLESLEKHYPKPQDWLTFHFTDDASPDPQVGSLYLEHAFFRRPDVKLTKHRKNLGYTRNINQAIRKLEPESALILLNSDTIVGQNLFESLHRVALHNHLLGSLSPLSNSATICSLFGWPHGGKNPFPFSPQKISQLVDELKIFHSLVPTPTTVGFCMYIPAAALRIAGLFNEKLFARGYGEENEWCLRSSRLGLQHFIYTGAYVHHEGSQSFGKEKYALIQKGLGIIDRLYPTYSEEVENFIRSDKFDCVRLGILNHLSEVQRRDEGNKLVIFVSHADPEEKGGGVQTHIRYLSQTLATRGKIDTIQVFNIHGRWKMRYVQGNTPIWDVLLRSSAASLHQAMLSLLPYSIAIHFHHTMHFPKKVLSAVLEFEGPKKIITCHDYFLVCPSITLTGPQQTFCNIPKKKESCASCLDKKYQISNFSLEQYRQDSIGLLLKVDHIIFPSETARKILFRGLSTFSAPEFQVLLKEVEKKSSVIGHALPYSAEKEILVRSPRTLKKVIFLGGLSEAKGLHLLQKVIPSLNARGFTTEIWGKVGQPLRLSAKTKIREYQGIEELRLLRSEAQNAVVVIPSIWPETFCYTAYEALLVLKTPIVAFDIGHPERVITKWKVGTIAPKMTVPSLLQAVLKAKKQYLTLLKNVSHFCKIFPDSAIASNKTYLRLYRKAGAYPSAMIAHDPSTDLLNVESPVLTQTALFAEQFNLAKPFKYFVVDDFLKKEICDLLFTQFPAFETGNCLNEAGLVGGKSTCANVRNLGEAYRQFDNLMRSPNFLKNLGEMTGIPDLIYDPDYVGGGTHENRPGQDLDFHIDFNHHPKTKYHRRLNLILFLNPEWKKEWGGCLQLVEDPHSRLEEAHPEFVSLEPTYNRCIVFETTEDSWHGFERIHIPEGGPDSRKSIAVYFYSQTRPKSELGDIHSTVYKNRPLPKRFREGYQLTHNDEHLLQTLLARRDDHICFLYKRESQLMTELEKPSAAAPKGTERLENQPLEPKGFVKALAVKNLYDDNWVGPELEIQAMALARFSRFAIKGWSPDWSPEARSLSVYLNDKKIREFSVGPGKFNLDLQLPLQPRELFILKIECSLSTVPKSLGISQDLRPLSWLLDSATFDT